MWVWLEYILFGDRNNGYIPDEAYRKLEEVVKRLEALIKGT